MMSKNDDNLSVIVKQLNDIKVILLIVVIFQFLDCISH